MSFLVCEQSVRRSMSKCTHNTTLVSRVSRDECASERVPVLAPLREGPAGSDLTPGGTIRASHLKQAECILTVGSSLRNMDITLR
jgi:hypothetical protein